MTSEEQAASAARFGQVCSLVQNVGPFRSAANSSCNLATIQIHQGEPDLTVHGWVCDWWQCASDGAALSQKRLRMMGADDDDNDDDAANVDDDDDADDDGGGDDDDDEHNKNV